MRYREDGELAKRATDDEHQPRQDEEDKRDPLLVEIGRKLLKARLEAGLRQTELAAKAGITNSTVFMVENGRQNVSVKSLCALANALGLQPCDLLPGEDLKATASMEGLQRVAESMIGALGRATLLADQLKGTTDQLESTAKLLNAARPAEGGRD